MLVVATLREGEEPASAEAAGDPTLPLALVWLRDRQVVRARWVRDPPPQVGAFDVRTETVGSGALARPCTFAAYGAPGWELVALAAPGPAVARFALRGAVDVLSAAAPLALDPAFAGRCAVVCLWPDGAAPPLDPGAVLAAARDHLPGYTAAPGEGPPLVVYDAAVLSPTGAPGAFRHTPTGRTVCVFAAPPPPGGATPGAVEVVAAHPARPPPDRAGGWSAVAGGRLLVRGPWRVGWAEDGAADGGPERPGGLVPPGAAAVAVRLLP